MSLSGVHAVTREASKTRRRRMIVHVGVQKTGSTAIQRHLNRNAEHLADTLIVRTPKEGTPMRPLGRAAIAYSLAPSKDTETALRVAFETVLETLPDNGLPVLISHENLAGAMPGNGGERGLYPHMPKIAAIIGEVAAHFTMEFVIYTRNMKDWKPSVWAQSVRTDGNTGTLARFEDATADLPGWGDLSRRMAEELGSDRVTRFKIEAETDQSRPGRQLLRHAGLKNGRIDALDPLEGASMPRLSDASIEFLRHLNGVPINHHARHKIAELVVRNQHLFAGSASGAA